MAATMKSCLLGERHMFRPVLFAVLLAFMAFAVTLSAQTKPAPTLNDYAKWESLVSAGSYGGFSPDGEWLAHGINRTNGDNELRVIKLADGTVKTAAFGVRPVFSSDSKWIVYLIGQSEEEREKLRKEKKPVQNGLGILDLAVGEISTFEGVESFSLSSDGAYLAMQRYRPTAPAGPPGPGRPGAVSGPGERLGATLIVRNLASGSDMTFGNVSQFVWQDSEQSRLLAMTISAEGKTGNAVHLYDAGTGVLRVLDSSSSVYSGLTWRRDAGDLAVYRAMEDEKKEGPTQVLLAWTGLGKDEKQLVYGPTEDPEFPEGMRTVTFRSLRWSDDGSVLFFGVAEWEDKMVPDKKPEKGEGKPSDEPEARSTEIPGKNPAAKTAGKAEPKPPAEEPATVEIWHWKDVYVMPWQKTHARQDRQRNMLSAWHLKSGRFVQLGMDPIHENVTPIRHSKLAYVEEWSKYAMERSIGRMGADLYLVDITSGERTKLLENINDWYVEAGPSGKYLLFLQDKHYWTVDLATLKITNITENAPVSFIDVESDTTSKVYPDRLQKPPFGVAGWSKGDESVFLYDKYDLWKVDPDGSGVERLTDGASEQVRHRLVWLDERSGGSRWGRFAPSSLVKEPWIDLDKPVYLSIFGEWTKKSGYARLDPTGAVSRLVWIDKYVSSLAKAKESDAYRYMVQGFDDSPDIFVGGSSLKDAEQVTETNAFQAEYAWGRSELIEYVTDKGRRLQGALLYPAGYEPGRKHPMIVYNYELLSQTVHRYIVPSDRSYYNVSVFTHLGYLVLMPDIVFRKRQPGWSVVECITAGVDKVIEMGVVDPERVGVVGHSMGGFNTSFIATHTNGVFAAAVAGAPIADLVSYYGDHHWGSGVAETDHIETGQERMEVALYEDLQAYIDNSAVYNVHNMTTPLLLEHGESDGIIAWYQSIMLYNIARRAKKNVVMLGYIGADHGLRKKSNQKDYQRRILAWFGHYLKGEPAEDWITEGKSFLAREDELKRIKEKK